MIYLISSLIALVYNRKNSYSVTQFMLWLFLASSIGAFLVGRQHSWDIESVLLVIYTTVVLWIIFFSYFNYSKIRITNFRDINNQKLLLFEKYITIAGLVAVLLEIYIMYRVMGLMLIGMTTVDEFKNGDGSDQTAIYNSVIPHAYLTLCHFVSPIGYIFLSLHFYYLINENKKKAIKYILLSLVLVFHGLIGLSRSITVVFLLTYTCMFFFVMPMLKKEVRRRFLKVFVIVTVIATSLLMVISNARFSEYYTKNSKNDALIDEKEHPVLFSLIDYFVMWNETGLDYMKLRPDGLVFYGWYNSSGLPIMIENKVFGNDKIYEQREKGVEDVIEKHTGSLWWLFQGCVARLTYEWGYFGTVLFAFLFLLIIKKMSPQKGVLRFRDLLCLPVLLPMGLTFWQGIGLGGLDVQLGMVYCFIFYSMAKSRRNVVAIKRTPFFIENTNKGKI